VKKLNKLISASTQATVRENHRIREMVSRIVPARNLAHILFCRLEGGRLRITVDSAAWIARLRFGERQMISALRAEELEVHTISWHVAADETPRPRTTRRTANPLSPGAAESLIAAAEMTREEKPASGIVGEPDPASDKLRQELLKLAAKLRE